MSEDEIRAVVLEELGNIAPEADMSAVDPKADLREELDIDSMDFLNFITALHDRLGVNVPELDYPKLTTVDGAVVYLQGKRTE
ncbi:MAG: acyl carrier protein [Alphaproteobacteria bacterium]|jgi:acyl carrier protein|nr:acyl carrier protein [Alphaproteobacteria bacterium]